MIKKLISLILIFCLVLPCFCEGVSATEKSESQLTEFDLILEKYKDKCSYARAVYTGGYDALSLGDEMQDVYAYGYMYSKYVNSRTDFHGYIYKIDEAKQKFGAADSKVVAAESSGARYYAPKFDNSFRHENDIEDKSGIKKDAWFSTGYFRGDRLAMAGGGISFGIGKGDKISIDDNEFVFVFEYFDNGYNPITLEYVNTDWDVGVYATSSYVVPRGDTNKWRTAIIYVNDAKFAPEHNTMRSAFCSGREDFVVRGNDVAISGMMVLKAKDCIGDLYDPSSPGGDEYSIGEPVYCPKQVITKNGTTYNFVQINGKKTIQPYVTNQNWNKDGIKFLCGYENLMFEYDTVNETYRFLDVASCNSALHAFVTPDNFIYYMHNKRVYKINWDTYERTLVCQLPEGVNGFSNPTVSNDGKYMTGYYSGQDFGGRLVLLNLETGKIEKVYDRTMYASNNVEISLGHPLVNPGYPNIIFFCGEGIDTNYLHERMFTVDTNTDKMTMIYQQSYVDETYTGEAAGHEAWSMNGDYLYFVKYNLGKTKGTNYVGRIPFKNGVFTGEREIINGDASYWHCYPSGDNNWAVADTNTGEVYLMSAKNHSCDLIAQFEKISSISPNGREYYYDHPYQPHPRMSYNGKSINWQMASDNNPDNLGVAWADVSAYTQNTDYTENIYPSDDGNIISYKNTKSQAYEKQIQGKTFVCADNGNNVYYNIDDNYIKNINIPVRLAFTAYIDSDDEITIGYTSGVKDEYNFHKYQDKKIVLDAKKGINTYTVDMGYINAFNVCDYRSDMYFCAKNGTVCVDDIMVSTYDETFDIYTKDAIYTLSANGDDESYGLYALNVKQPIVDINDKQSILDLGIDEKSYELAKNAGYKYVTSSSDGAWNYKTVTDADGITKNAWFTTKHARFINGEPRHLGGYIYFGVSNNVITKDDSELIVTVEYLDNRTEPFQLLYLTGKNTYGNKKIVPSNSGKWKTVTFALNDAVLSGTNSGTGLGSGKEDMRFEAYSVDLYISKVIIQKADKKIVKAVLLDKSKSGATVTNNTSSDSDAKLYTAVFDNVGTLLRIYVSEDTTVGAMNTSELTNNITANKGETIKSFVLENNIKPYVPTYNPLELSVTVTEECAILSWNGFKDKDDVVYYEVYCDGKYIATVTDTTYTADKSYSSYMVKAVDLYGKQLETSYNHHITFK